ncbi:MAG: ABC transporter ATP-binding protein [Candidatus Liptonbacteria bacterium]
MTIDAITVRDLTKRYKRSEHNAIDHISFSVHEGEFFALLGPNGAGKTTTLSILTTTLSKTSGEVLIAGHDLDRYPHAVRRSIGVMFQGHSLDDLLTAEENIRMHVALYGAYPFRPFFGAMPRPYRRRLMELAAMVGLENNMFELTAKFSGGMKRKLEVIRALIHKPKILFLDEPSTGLDPVSRKAIWDYIHTIRERDKVTVFLTTHYLDEAEAADLVCIVNHGKIMLKGTPENLKEKLLDKKLEIDAENKDALRAELYRKKIRFSEDKHFIVPLVRANAQKIISSIKTPLTLVKTESPTLEEAYIQIIKNGRNH